MALIFVPGFGGEAGPPHAEWAALLLATRSAESQHAEALQSSLRDLLLKNGAVAYSSGSIVLAVPSEGDDKQVGKEILEAAGRQLTPARDRRAFAGALCVAVGDGGWDDGDLVVRLVNGHRRAAIGLVGLVEEFDRVAADEKLGVLVLRTEGDVAREHFERLGKLCRLWNRRRQTTTWLVCLTPRDAAPPSGGPRRIDEGKELLDDLAGRADETGDGDGIVDAREIANCFLARGERGVAGGSDRFVWRTDPVGVEPQEADASRAQNASDLPMAVAANPPRWAQAKRRVARLAALCEIAKLEPAVFEEGSKLLARMPCDPADRKLRQSYVDYCSGQLDADMLRAARAAARLQRRLDGQSEAARTFAAAYGEAYSLARSRFVRPNRVNQAAGWSLLRLLDLAEGSVGGSTAGVRGELAELATRLDDALGDLPTRVRLAIGERSDWQGRRCVDRGLKLFAAGLDQYGDYFPPAEYAEEKKLNEGHFTGLGLQVTRARRGGLEIAGVLPGGPGHRAGLKPGDRIVRIDDRQLLGMEYDQAANLLVGKRGQQARLLIERPLVVGNLQVRIRFDRIEIETVLGWSQREAAGGGRSDGQKGADAARAPNAEEQGAGSLGGWNYWLDREESIAYVRLSAFSDETPARLRAVLAELRLGGRGRGLGGLVLDLRGNPGGVLGSAIEVAGLLIGAGKIVDLVDGSGNRESKMGSAFGSLRDFPIAVVVDRNSASGSELLAAALQDHRRAVVVGERTFGKGSVQTLFEIDGGKAAFKLTTATFERPNGRPLNRFASSNDDDDWGVTPDPKHRVRFTDRETENLAAKFAADASVGRQPEGIEIDPRRERGIRLALEALAAQRSQTSDPKAPLPKE